MLPSLSVAVLSLLLASVTHAQGSIPATTLAVPLSIAIPQGASIGCITAITQFTLDVEKCIPQNNTEPTVDVALGIAVCVCQTTNIIPDIQNIVSNCDNTVSPKQISDFKNQCATITSNLPTTVITSGTVTQTQVVVPTSLSQIVPPACLESIKVLAKDENACLKQIGIDITIDITATGISGSPLALANLTTAQENSMLKCLCTQAVYTDVLSFKSACSTIPGFNKTDPNSDFKDGCRSVGVVLSGLDPTIQTTNPQTSTTTAGGSGSTSGIPTAGAGVSLTTTPNTSRLYSGALAMERAPLVGFSVIVGVVGALLLF